MTAIVARHHVATSRGVGRRRCQLATPSPACAASSERFAASAVKSCMTRKSAWLMSLCLCLPVCLFTYLHVERHAVCAEPRPGHAAHLWPRRGADVVVAGCCVKHTLARCFAATITRHHTHTLFHRWRTMLLYSFVARPLGRYDSGTRYSFDASGCLDTQASYAFIISPHAVSASCRKSGCCRHPQSKQPSYANAAHVDDHQNHDGVARGERATKTGFATCPPSALPHAQIHSHCPSCPLRTPDTTRTMWL